jgi:hypothetical protein
VLRTETSFPGDVMHQLIIANGEGAQTAFTRSGTVSTPYFVVWPAMGPAATPSPEVAEQIYRLALEWARAALSSPYARAQCTAPN